MQGRPGIRAKATTILLFCFAVSVARNRGGSPPNNPLDSSRGTRGGTGTSLSPIPDIQIFDLPPGFSEPSHMDPLKPSLLIPRGFVGIDVAHRQGRIHTGSIMYVVDTHDHVLLLRRGPDLVTCPNTWSIVGEHHFRKEVPLEAARRGLVEELGKSILDHDVEGVHNLTASPLYYIRNYGPTNGNRVDRQLTYLWEVRLNKRYEGVHLDLDDEVAEHRWVPLDKFKRWIDEDSADGLLKDFCHETITVLLQKGFEGLERKRRQKKL